MNIYRNKKRLIGITILLSVLISISIHLHPLLTQEKNTVSILSGIVQLNQKELDIFEYDSDNTTKYYITRTKDKFEPAFLMFENEGWIYKEQFGSGFLFQNSSKEEEKLTVGSIQFSRYYVLWKVPQGFN
jgi:hypothetical protein